MARDAAALGALAWPPRDRHCGTAGRGKAADRDRTGWGGLAAARPSRRPAPPQTCTDTGTVPREGSTRPELCVSQPTGDGETVFIIHGSGSALLARVTVSLAWLRAPSRYHPVADEQGTFNYAIDQGHFSSSGGEIPPGSYTAVVAVPGGGTVRTPFYVHPPGQGQAASRRRTAASPRRHPALIARGPAGTPSPGPWSTTGPPAGSTMRDRPAAAGRWRKQRRARSGRRRRPHPTAGCPAR